MAILRALLCVYLISAAMEAVVADRSAAHAWGAPAFPKLSDTRATSLALCAPPLGVTDPWMAAPWISGTGISSSGAPTYGFARTGTSTTALLGSATRRPVAAAPATGGLARTGRTAWAHALVAVACGMGALATFSVGGGAGPSSPRRARIAGAESLPRASEPSKAQGSARGSRSAWASGASCVVLLAAVCCVECAVATHHFVASEAGISVVSPEDSAARRAGGLGMNSAAAGSANGGPDAERPEQGAADNLSGDDLAFAFQGGYAAFGPFDEARELEEANRRAQAAAIEQAEEELRETPGSRIHPSQLSIQQSERFHDGRRIDTILEQLRSADAPELHSSGRRGAGASGQAGVLYSRDTADGGGTSDEGTIQLQYHNLDPSDLTGLVAPDITGAGISGEEFYEGSMTDDVYTTFDYLDGIRRRKDHPEYDEVEIVALFQAQGGVHNVRARLEASIVELGHNTLDAWPLWSQLGNTWRATGNVNRAIQCFRKALSIKPTDPDVLLNLAVVLQNLDYLEDAELLIREAVALHPSGVLHHFIMGNVLSQRGDLSGAMMSYERALALQPTFAPCEKKIEDLRALGVLSSTASFGETVLHYLRRYGGFVLGLAMMGAGYLVRPSGRFADKKAAARDRGKGNKSGRR